MESSELTCWLWIDIKVGNTVGACLGIIEIKETTVRKQFYTMFIDEEREEKRAKQATLFYAQRELQDIRR